MSRCDQWIGLTKKGQEFWNELSNSHQVKKIKIGEYAFPAPGYEDIIGEEIVDGNITYSWNIQADPWSSGPMYFINIKKVEKGKKPRYICNWKEDENTHGEVDFEKGTFYI